MKQGHTLGQQLSHRQTATLAPQLQQGVRMLQLSSTELQAEIELALQKNPFLEKLEFDAEFELPVEGESRNGTTATGRTKNRSDSFFIHAHTSKPLNQAGYKSDSTAGIRPENSPSDAYGDVLEASAEQSLHDYLREQASATPLSDRQHYILELLIDSVNDRGYLRATLNDIVQLAMPDYVIRETDVARMISVLQDFEPVGVGARNTRECLLLQLDEIEADNHDLQLARLIVAHHLLPLARAEYGRIAEDLGQTQSSVVKAVKLIRQLNPFPGSSISKSTEQGAVPDLLVRKNGDSWSVRLNPNLMPAICIGQDSEDLIRLAAGQAGYDKLKQTLQDAKSLLSNIERRFYTLLRVATLIVERQVEYLDNGESALKPLTQKEIADSLEIHVSTVSRAVNEKQILTPAGVVELTSLFSRGLSRESGDPVSAKAIQLMIKNLVDAEPHGKPLSDNRITNLLNEKGIKIARRTVMKYREKLGIPASPKRRQP